MSETIVSVQAVSKYYNGLAALKDVSFEIKRNDFIGIIGPNGGGKSDKGTIRYHIPGNKIGYLPQVHSFDKKFPITVEDVVLSGLPAPGSIISRHTSDEKDKARHWMLKLGIDKLRKKPIGNLSGGEMQRAFLCRSLISEPELIILDEPDTYVDNRFEGELYEELKQLNANMTILLVSHDVGTITSYIKSIACVNGNLHYHPSNIISEKQLASYNCPIQIITHGEIPHTVLGQHDHKHEH
jgi:zinc transport system ATP-binding protein